MKQCHQASISDDQIKEILSDNGLNRTKIKVEILVIISSSKIPLSTQDIFERLENHNCNISTVFRTLVQFKEKNIINEIDLGEGFSRYEMHRKDHHHHHVRCRKCGQIIPLHHCDLSRFENEIISLGFVQVEHRLEFSGVCQKCA